MTTVPVFASTSVTITATYSGSKTATLTVTADVSFLMNRGEEMLLASASREEEEVVPDEPQAAEEVVTALTATTPQQKPPAFKLASLWTLGKSPFSQLFRDRLQMDPHDGGLADDLDGEVGFLSRPLWDFRLSSGTAARSSSGARTALTTTGARYFFYTPDMNLMAETELTSTPTPLVLYEYIWFGGQPVAQVDSAGTTSWTFTDHLGTPIIQTDSAGSTYWRAEHEPYGQVFALRTADQHQPLRLPGQEAEQLNLGSNGATERSYNVFRWYRNGWGRYTQPDPVGNLGDANPILPPPLPDPEVFTSFYSYTLGNPVNHTDPLGLLTFKSCSQDQQRQITDAFNGYCKRIQDPQFGTCMCQKASIPGGLGRLCSKANRPFRCKANNAWPCGSNVCAWSLPFGDVIRLCPLVWQPNSGCGPLGCTLMQEMTHQLGHPWEKWPKEVEKCLGCG